MTEADEFEQIDIWIFLVKLDGVRELLIGGRFKFFSETAQAPRDKPEEIVLSSGLVHCSANM